MLKEVVGKTMKPLYDYLFTYLNSKLKVSLVIIIIVHRTRSTALSTVTGVWAGHFGVQILAGEKFFSSLKHPTGYGTHAAFHPMDSGVLYRAWNSRNVKLTT